MTAVRVAATALGTSVLVAIVFVVLNGGFGVGDVTSFVFYSLPFAALSGLIARLVRRPSDALHPALRLPLAVVAGVAAGIAWTFVVALLLGPWIGAFSFPVLFCWSAGGAAAMVALAAAGWARQWLVIPTAVVLSSAVALLLVTQLRARDERLDVVVYFEAGVTSQEVSDFWSESLTEPQESGVIGRGHLEGIRSIGASYGTPMYIFIELDAGVSEAERQEILERLRSSPLVARVETDVEAPEGGLVLPAPTEN